MMSILRVFVLSYYCAGHVGVIDVLPYLGSHEDFPLWLHFQNIGYGGFSVGVVIIPRTLSRTRVV